MSDVYSSLYTITGLQKYLDTAKIFNRAWFITPLAADRDILQNIHANTHIAQAVGIARTANLSGDSTSLRASENFWKLVTRKHSFVTRGNSFHEWFDKAGVEAGPSIEKGGKATPATLHLRIPLWISGAPALAINGRAQAQSLSAGTYVSLNRLWKAGDVITLTNAPGVATPRIRPGRNLNGIRVLRSPRTGRRVGQHRYAQ
jgi:DUF1680 family protein